LREGTIVLRASVLIPTHEHAATLPFAVASVQAQKCEEIEILIIGDGANDAIRSTVRRLQEDDARIRYFDFPKSPRTGEPYRDSVLRQARGRIVCYQSDDDLWLPGHLVNLEQALADADIAGAMHTNVGPNGDVRGYFFDPTDQAFGEPYLRFEHNGLGPWASDGIGLSFVAHRLDAYLRLPEGWTTTPPGLPTDQFMWMKFLRQDWCRWKILPWPIALHFSAPERSGWTDARRAEELARWTDVITAPDGKEQVYRQLLDTFRNILLQQAVADRGARNAESIARAAERDAILAARDALSAECNSLRAQRDALRSAHDALSAECDRLSVERAALLDSTSWQWTSPMRASVEFLRRLRS
jgi:hypothetical protein